MFDVLTARLKHLPGRHDQSAHGRPGRVGTAFRSAYSAARAEGKNHREARDAAKTAAEQVRQTIRDEKRADLIANPKPKRVMPARVTPPPVTPATPASLRDRSVDEIAAEFERLLDVQPIINPALSAAVASARMDFEAAAFILRNANRLNENAIALVVLGRLTPEQAVERKQAYDAAKKEYAKKQKIHQKLKADELFESTQPYVEGYMKFLTQMRHPSDPGAVVFTHTGGTPRERERAEVLMSAVAAMVPMVRNIPGDAMIIPIKVEHSPVRGEYTFAKIRTSSDPGTIVHEMLHALQSNHSHTQMNDITENWAMGRIVGEKRQSLQTLQPNFGYSSDEVAYKDKVDNPYALKDYGANRVKKRFLEVLTMAFTVDPKAPIRGRNDKDLLRVGIESILGTKEN